MGIKYLKGIYGDTKPKTTRPEGLKFPIGLKVTSPTASANSANTTTSETFDVLLVAGGGTGGGARVSPLPWGASNGGGAGAGGLRIFSANSFTDLTGYLSPLSTDPSGVNFIPVTVGGGGGSSAFGGTTNSTGGTGGCGGQRNPESPSAGQPGFPGSSGGGGGIGQTNGGGGTGIFGQGCNGGTAGGSALANNSTTGGLTTAITGSNIRYADGGGPGAGNVGTANRGNGGGGGPRGGGPTQPAPALLGGSGGSGIVALRYRNPASPTTALASGGDCVCCTGGCIIHIFNSSGFFNVATQFSIN